MPSPTLTDQWKEELRKILVRYNGRRHSSTSEFHAMGKAIQELDDILQRTKEEAYAQGDVDCGVEVAATGKRGTLDFSDSPFAKRMREEAERAILERILNADGGTVDQKAVAEWDKLERKRFLPTPKHE